MKKFPALYGTRMFITTYTSDGQLFLASSRSVLASPLHFLKIHFNIILSSQPSYSQWSLSLKYPHQNPIWTSYCWRRTKGSGRACGPHIWTSHCWRRTKGSDPACGPHIWTSHCWRRTKGSGRACGPHIRFLTTYVFAVVSC
jgi:hypothetical protein